MTPLELILVFVAGALASAINAVAGGGTLVTFPFLTMSWGVGLPANVANATNALGLWPGALGSVLGFWNLIHRTFHHFRALIVPTIVGAIVGAELFVQTPAKTFDFVVPVLILLASALLLVQKSVKAWVTREDRVLHPMAGLGLQFVVAVYGGYFGAGMGIMMLAAFALYMDASLHEINGVKSLLGLFINILASGIFMLHAALDAGQQGLVDWNVGIVLALGSLIGGFFAAKVSQKVDPDKLRVAIAAYGVLAAGYYALKAFGFL